jgi:shikimate kinase
LIDQAQAHLFLVGFMGAGKSTVAALIAERSGRALVDVDATIEQRTGRSIAEWLSPETEPEFRRAETEVLEGLGKTPKVVAVGGGGFASALNRALMRRAGVTVWLDGSLAEMRERTGTGVGRPLWRETDPIEFRAFFERRRAVYALADIRVETSRKPLKIVSDEVWERFDGFFN